MSKKNKKQDKDQKQKYKKPAIIHNQKLEAFAGSCSDPDPVNGKTGSGDLCTIIGN